MISIQHISKTFHQKNKVFKALDDVSLEIEQGDIVGVIGFSGAGKSTLIRTVNLLEKPDEGKIIVNGKNLAALNHRDLATERKKIGMIFQHFNLLSSRTVYDNIALPLELEGTAQAAIKQKVNELLQVVGLEDKAHDYPNNLSGGQKQRVAIARALANNPYVLLCDEATSALDPATTQSILQLLKDINKRLGITILLITHEMEVIKAICNHVAVIDQGKLIAKGTLEEIIAKRDHPIIKQFITTKTLQIPAIFLDTMQENPGEGLFPLVETDLNENLSFDRLIDLLTAQYDIPYTLLTADVEYLGQAHFGKILFQLKGSSVENTKVYAFFNKHNISFNIKGYA